MSIRSLGIAVLSLALVSGFAAQKRKGKKDQEPPTQVLPPLPEPPEAVAGETARLSFQVSPLSSKGLLSQQVRDALKALIRESRGAGMIELRAFVAGSGDLRRVQTIVSEEFTDRKLPLPALTTVQAGDLPMEGAQVQIESIALDKRTVNPNGIAFFAARDQQQPAEVVERLKIDAKSAGVMPEDMLRITCFLSSLDQAAGLRSAIGSGFPAAAASYIQTQRLGLQPFMACEAAGRITRPGTEDSVQSGYVAIHSPKLVFSGAQMVFGDRDSDIKLAFQRLGKSLQPLGAGDADVLWTRIYSLTKPMAARVESGSAEVYRRARPSFALLFEGLPSIDATAAVELIAVAH